MARKAIDPSRDRDILLDHPTRRAIARSCRSRPLSVTELESALRRRGLKDIVENMALWKILVIAGKTARGCPRYRLAKPWHKDLDAAIRADGTALIRDHDFYLLSSPDLGQAARCLARGHTKQFSWVGVFGANNGIAIAVSGSGSAKTVGGLREVLEDDGVTFELTQMGDQASGADIEPFLRGLGAGDGTQL